MKVTKENCTAGPKFNRHSRRTYGRTDGTATVKELYKNKVGLGRKKIRREEEEEEG